MSPIVEDILDGLETKTDQLSPGWCEAAQYFLLKHLAEHHTGTGESVRKAAKEEGFPSPHDMRAWGIVFRRASEQQLIRKVDHYRAASSHGNEKPVWSLCESAESANHCAQHGQALGTAKRPGEKPCHVVPERPRARRTV